MDERSCFLSADKLLQLRYRDLFSLLFLLIYSIHFLLTAPTACEGIVNIGFVRCKCFDKRRTSITGNSLIAIVIKHNAGLIIITNANHITSNQIDVAP